MNLALVIHGLSGGGAERVVANLANHWAVQGRTVTVVTLAGVCPEDYPLHPMVRRIGLDRVGPAASRWAAVRSNMDRLLRLRDALRAAAPQIVLGFMPVANVLLGLARMGLSGVFVGSERCHPPFLPLSRPWRWARRLAYGQLDAVVALTEPMADWIRDHTRAPLVATIPNPVPWPLPDGAPRVDPASMIDPKRRLLLLLGRLAPEKQPEVALDAFATLATRHPEWDLAIVGDGPLGGRLRDAVQAKGLAGRVWMPGRVGNVGDWYRRSDLYLMTSAYEGFPNSLAEAMACGACCVSFDCKTGPSDIITDGLNGRLVTDGDRLALERVLAQLMSDLPTRQRLAGHSSDARARWSLERVSAQWDALFARLAADAQHKAS